jgi:hypothetical protein
VSQALSPSRIPQSLPKPQHPFVAPLLRPPTTLNRPLSSLSPLALVLPRVGRQFSLSLSGYVVLVDLVTARKKAAGRAVCACRGLSSSAFPLCDVEKISTPRASSNAAPPMASTVNSVPAGNSASTQNTAGGRPSLRSNASLKGTSDGGRRQSGSPVDASQR